MLLAQAVPVSDTIKLWTAIVALAFIAALGAAVIYFIFTKKINLSRLISEPNGDASMSRFQLLIFTFIIAMSFFLIVVGSGHFPDPIPQGVLVLLGISSSSYLVSKGIQFSNDAGVIEHEPAVVITPNSVTLGWGKTQKFTVQPIRLDGSKFNWDLNPVGEGTIAWSADTLTGEYTAPNPPPPGGPPGTPRVELKVSCQDNPNISDVAVIHFS